MTPAPEPSPTAPRRRGPPRPVQVTKVQSLSPLMRRVTFGGTGLLGFDPGLAASYIKITFPEPGQTAVVAPSPDGPRPLMRTYTPRSFDASANELVVDFVLHGTGPAANWAEQAAPGQTLFMMGPGPGYAMDLAARRFLLIGDDSALPAIETLLEHLPCTASARVLVEVAGVQEQRPLAGSGGSEVQWAVRRGGASQAGTALLQALAQWDAPPADTRVYLACEAAAMRRIKQWMLAHWPIPAAQITGRGYWKLGNSNHPDHDYGE